MDVSQMVDDIKLLLGGNVVSLEIDEEEISNLIHMAYRKIRPKLSAVKYLTLPCATCIDLSGQNVIDVIRCYPTVSMNTQYTQTSSNEYLFDFQIYDTYNYTNNIDRQVSIVRNASLADYNIGFFFENNKLYISENNVTSNVTVECLVESTIEELNDDKVESWIQDYSVALCKETIGRIRSKYRPQNLPVELDGETLLSEAQSEKQDAIQQLEEKDFGIYILMR